MSDIRKPSSGDEVPLSDLMVGEPAVNRVLDGAAARAKAEQLVREVSADPRLAEVVSRMERAVVDDPDGDATVRERNDSASEVRRAQQTLPRLDPHARVTDPRLHQRNRDEHESDELRQAAREEAFERARRDLGATATATRADHRRLAILGATALAVGIILLALLVSRGGGASDNSAPTTPTAQPGEIDIEMAAPPGTAGSPTPAAATATASAPAPASAPASATVAPSSVAPDTSTSVQSAPPTAPPSAEARAPQVETNPKSSTPKPPPSQDVPGPSTKPSSDRPF